jgi:hypothetical protein
MLTAQLLVVAPVVRWSFAGALPRASVRGFPFCCYGGGAGLSERRPNLWGWRGAGERHWPAY